jgi:hypothetical protein
MKKAILAIGMCEAVMAYGIGVVLHYGSMQLMYAADVLKALV